MTSKSITDALALAAYELSEAESAIRRAELALRKARKRQRAGVEIIAGLHAEILTATETIQLKTRCTPRK